MKQLKPIVTDIYDFPTQIRDDYVYVDKTARAARKQIDEKGYGKPYAADKRRVVAVGVNYDPRRLDNIEVASEVVNPSGEVVNSIDEVVNDANGRQWGYF